MGTTVIRNIWAVGRNYADHAKELNNPLPKEPLFFLKAGSSAQEGSVLKFPTTLGELHHEVELALRFNDKLQFSHYCVALDLTDRTAQNEAKKQGLPWTRAKSFKGACVLSPWQEFQNQESFWHQQLRLSVNGEIRQMSLLTEMIFRPPELRLKLLEMYPVEPGDVLLTGTPAGVGPLKKGDQLIAQLGHESEIYWGVET
ncbi:MAG: fumarylacetoacetate hydrolase family protein [Bdellovibrionales bacterium]|nr:fumarylacetoacetate hydrolase family protein [Bdellovibrionales bacterium]